MGIHIFPTPLPFKSEILYNIFHKLKRGTLPSFFGAFFFFKQQTFLLDLHQRLANFLNTSPIS